MLVTFIGKKEDGKSYEVTFSADDNKWSSKRAKYYYDNGIAGIEDVGAKLEYIIYWEKKIFDTAEDTTLELFVKNLNK